jgi:hypothetical protein
MTHPRAQEIINRYFQVIDLLLAVGAIKTNAFYRDWQVHKGTIHNTRIGRQEKIPLQLIYALVTDYGVSAKWLITGHGKMFARSQAPNDLQHQRVRSPA